MTNVADFDTEKYYLGAPCKAFGHTWNNTDQCLRFKRDRGCFECCSKKRQLFPNKYKAEDAEYRRRNVEKIKEQGRQFRLRNSDRLKAKRQEETQEKKEAERIRKRTYAQNNREKVRECHTRWRKNHPEKARLCSLNYARKRRAQQRNAFGVNFTAEDFTLRVEQFEGKCAYCNKEKKLTADHFIPLSKGGSDSLGNILPVCHQCNVRKNAIDPCEWYSRQVFFSQVRWKKILRVLGKDKASYDQLTFL